MRAVPLTRRAMPRVAGAPRADAPARAPTVLCLLFVFAAWLGNGLYALGSHGGPLKTWSPALVASAMVGFVLIHGRHSGGWRSVLLFVATVIPVTWAAESLGLMTGFPFGDYHYSDSMGPFIGRVPVTVLSAYCVMGYVSWAMARILLHRVDCAVDRTMLIGGPIVAAVLMVIWDVSMDPLRATVEQRWIWRDAGPHYGVPLSNFIGWFAVTWTMFQLYALVLARHGPAKPPAAVHATEYFWAAAPLMYLSFAVEYIANPWFAAGQDAGLQALYQGVAMGAAVTMLPAAVLTAARVRLAVGLR